MDLFKVNLNLLVVFDALLMSKSVTKAARQLGLSQPAMSYELNKLRTLFNDPLFIRIHNEMCPTPRAQALSDPVRRVIEAIRTEVLGSEAFDPLSTRREFVFCMNDVGEMYFIPRIIRALQQHAPHARVRAVSLGPSQLDEALESGEVDLAMGYFPDLIKASTYQQQLHNGSFVCIARCGNPFIGNALSLQGFLAAPAVAVSSTVRTWELIEKELRAARFPLRIELRVSHFLSLLDIVAETDMIAAVPLNAAEFLVKNGRVRIHALPFESPTFPVRQHWHKRYHNTPENIWIRSLLRDLFQAQPIAPARFAPHAI